MAGTAISYANAILVNGPAGAGTATAQIDFVLDNSNNNVTTALTYIIQVTTNAPPANSTWSIVDETTNQTLFTGGGNNAANTYSETGVNRAGHDIRFIGTGNAGSGTVSVSMFTWIIPTINLKAYLSIGVSGLYTGASVQAQYDTDSDTATLSEVKIWDTNNNNVLEDDTSPPNGTTSTSTVSASVPSNNDIMDDGIEFDLLGITGYNYEQATGTSGPFPYTQHIFFTHTLTLNAPTIPT